MSTAELLAKIRDRGGSVTPRDVLRFTRAYRTTKEARRALNKLVATGQGCWVKAPTTSRGGRPTERFCVDTTPSSVNGNGANVHFQSSRHDWSTPQDLFDKLHAEFGFELDVCASVHNAKCERFFTLADDGLSQRWEGVCWMNPPYGNEIGKWMRKAWRSSQEGATVVCLVPARTDTKWWHEYAVQGEIRYLQGRLRFGGAENSAPFPSAVVIF